MTIADWAVVVFLYEGVRISGVLNGPPLPEVYANSFSFQLLASLYFLVGFWLPILVAMLLLEVLVFAIADRRRRKQGAARMDG